MIDRSGWNGPEAEAAVLRRLQKEVQALIAGYSKPPVDAGKLARMRAVVDRARGALLV